MRGNEICSGEALWECSESEVMLLLLDRERGRERERKRGRKREGNLAKRNACWVFWFDVWILPLQFDLSESEWLQGVAAYFTN